MATATATTTNTIREPAARRSFPAAILANRSIRIGSLEAWQIRTIEKIASFSGLPHGWDSYGSHPVSEELIDAAMEMVRQTPPLEDVPIPGVVPISGGGIHIAWEHNDRELELELRPDGCIDALACVNGEPIGLPARSVNGLLRWLVA
jgi:hypothetical protein